MTGALDGAVVGRVALLYVMFIEIFCVTEELVGVGGPDVGGEALGFVEGVGSEIVPNNE